MRIATALRIGASFGAGGGGGGLALSSLESDGWWPTPYSGSPLVGAASAGASGGRNMTNGTAPVVGASYNGKASVDFAAARKLSYATLGDMVSTSRYWGAVVGDVDSVTGTSLEGAAYENEPFYRNGSSNFGVTVRKLGAGPFTYKVQVWHYDGAWKAAEADISIGTPQIVLFKFEAGTISVKNYSVGGAWQTRAVGNMLSAAGDLSIGGESFAGTYLDGRWLDGLISKQAVPNDETFDQIGAALVAAYDL